MQKNAKNGTLFLKERMPNPDWTWSAAMCKFSKIAKSALSNHTLIQRLYKHHCKFSKVCQISIFHVNKFCKQVTLENLAKNIKNESNFYTRRYYKSQIPSANKLLVLQWCLKLASLIRFILCYSSFCILYFFGTGASKAFLSLCKQFFKA